MAWIAGSLWVSLGLGLTNNMLSVPIIMIGLFNVYAFVELTRKATPNWQKFFLAK
jgi:ABC-type phosphate transport system permease subunit